MTLAYRYLDASATAPLRPEAQAAMLRVWQQGQANASSVHQAGHHAARELERSRATIASAFGVRPGGVVFTSGGTEANNLAIIGRALAAPRGRHLVTTAIEHSSVLESCRYLERAHGFELSYLPVDGRGRLVDAAIPEVLRADTTLVAVGLANAEVGTVQDLSPLADATRKARIHLHVDAVQAAPSLPVGLAAGSWPGEGMDSLALASHKFGGPQGMGALLLPRDVPLEPLIHGGHHEGDRRAGTENVAGAAGFAAAVEASREHLGRDAVALMSSRDALISAVLGGVPGARLTGHEAERLPGHASFVVEGTSGEALLVALDTAGFAVSSGSACKAGSDEPSPALLAMGIPSELARSAIRFTLPAPIDEATITRIVEVMRGEVVGSRP